MYPRTPERRGRRRLVRRDPSSAGHSPVRNLGEGLAWEEKKPGAVGLRARELRYLPGKGQDISAAGVGLGLTVRVMVSGTSSPGRTIRPMMTYR